MGRGLNILNVLFVTSLVARYLGPAVVGILSAASATVAILKPFTSLGFTHLFVRDLVKDPDSQSSLVSTVLFVRCLLSILLFAFVSALLWFTTPNQTEFLIKLVVLLLLPLSIFEVFSDILKARLLASRLVIAGAWATVAMALARFIGVRLDASAVFFAAIILGGEVLRNLIVSVQAVNLIGPIAASDISPTRFVQLFRESWPLFISHIAASAYLGVDVLLLEYLAGSTSAGIYSVAARFTAFFFFIPTALASSFFPSLIKSHESNAQEYKSRFLDFLCFNVLAALGLAVIASVLVPQAILYLYGSSFANSVPVFRIHVFGLVFFFVGIARGQHFVITGDTRFTFACQLVGIITNLTLNLILIPVFAEVGAAIAAAATQVAYGLVASFIFPRTREIGVLQIRAIFSPSPSTLTARR